jgi:DnaJ-class molecular chaperone
MYGSNGNFGNLVITYEVDFPEFLDDEQKVQVRTIFQRHS